MRGWPRLCYELGSDAVELKLRAAVDYSSVLRSVRFPARSPRLGLPMFDKGFEDGSVSRLIALMHGGTPFDGSALYRMGLFSTLRGASKGFCGGACKVRPSIGSGGPLCW